MYWVFNTYLSQCTGRPGKLWFMGSQRVGHDQATELNWTHVRDPGKLSNLPKWTKISSSTQPSAKNKRGSWGWGGYQEKHRNQGWCWCRFKSWSSQLIRISGDLVILFFLVQRGSCYSVAQLCPTLWNPMDCSMPGSSIHGIFQARILAWVAIFFSKGKGRQG